MSDTLPTTAASMLQKPPADLESRRQRAYRLADVRTALSAWRAIGTGSESSFASASILRGGSGADNH